MATHQVIATVKRRNVVVLGKTGTGKSTVANKILGDDLTFEVGDSQESVTKKVTHSEVVIHVGTTHYHMKVIDTVGFFDTKMPNPKVLGQLKTFFREIVPDGVDLVLFVYNANRCTDEEKKTFDYLIKNFKKEISEISALVITGCESKTAAARTALKQEFSTNRTTETIASFMVKGIYPVGFPDLSTVDDGLHSHYKSKMKADADVLRKLAYESGVKHLSKEIFEEAFWRKCTIL